MDKLYSKLFGIGAAALIAVLSGLGVGSGGLLVIWLTVIEGIDAETARGLNLLFFVFSASAALLIHLMKGRLKLGFAAYLSVFACIGTLAGSFLGARIDPLLLKRIFGGMFIITGSYTLFGVSKNMFEKKGNFLKGSGKIFRKN